MAIVATMLNELLHIKSQIRFANLQEIAWSSRLTVNQERVAALTKQQTAYDKAYNEALDNTKVRTCGNIVVQENNTDTQLAELYAHAKVNFDEEILYMLEDEGEEYEVMVATYETMTKKLQADEESIRGVVDEYAKKDIGFPG